MVCVPPLNSEFFLLVGLARELRVEMILAMDLTWTILIIGWLTINEIINTLE